MGIYLQKSSVVAKKTIATPLWLLWKDSFDKGVIPKDLKLQYITPIYKKDNKTDAVNYRPVSLTSHLIKIFERVMRKHLVQHLEGNEILPAYQTASMDFAVIEVA